jgi:hypothetical protein
MDKDTLASLLRGRNRAGQPVDATANIIGPAMSALGNTIYGAGRGALTAMAGLPGDINQLITDNLGTLVNAQGLPTTKEIQDFLPAKPTTYEGKLAQKLGEFVPVNPTPIAKGAVAIAKPVGRAVGEQAYRMTEDMLQKQGMMPSIVPRDVANEMGMATTLPTDSIFAEAVKNTPSAQITDEGLVINVMRKQKPEQSMTESVRSGVFYLPEGSTNIKHYGGSNSYGGTEKITGETLYKNPLFVKGATGGKAPESAYAQLTSKADLKILQDDVFKAINSGSTNMRNDLVQQFLEKHAPDLMDYTSYIVDNSRKGNQLRYALQEAAVAQKVRDAGYDAVIGHSKGKAGPFISEIFDVRESHYPNAYGDYQLNPKFEEMYQNTPVSRKDIIEEQVNNLK